MAILRPTEPWAMTADKAAQRCGYAAKSELALRNAIELFCRERYPDARVVHEMVMGEGRVRCDVAAIGTHAIAAFEVKGEYDNTTRLLHQVGMYQLCVPEVWMVVPDKHQDDAELIHHLLPSVGVIHGEGLRNSFQGVADDRVLATKVPPAKLTVIHEADGHLPHPEAMLQMCWAEELTGICNRLRISIGPKWSRQKKIEALLNQCGLSELQCEVCVALRGRDALWRADQPIPTHGIAAGEGRIGTSERALA